MVFTATKFFNLIQWLLTVFLMASLLLFDSISWGKYLIIVCSALVFLMSVFKKRGKIKISLDPFIIFLLAFTAYVTLTAIWSIDSSETLTMANTLFWILFCFTLIYWAYMDESDPYRLITAVVVSSYVIAVYSVVVYGFNNIIQATDDIVHNTSFSNINSIALFLAFGFICDLYMVLFRRFRLYNLLSVLSIVIIASTRSRKSIVFVILGTLFILLFRYSKSKSFAFRIVKVVSVLIGALIVIYFVSKLPIFSSVNTRMDQMINTFFGSGKMDTSSLMRRDLVDLGVFCWSKRPINGIGIGSTHIIASQYLYFNSYLHNNYVELLAGGGVIAFLIYYSMYIYLIVGYFKIKTEHYQWFAFGIVMIVLLLIADYGRVSYYSKTVFFELMILFLILRSVKNTGKEPDNALQSA